MAPLWHSRFAADALGDSIDAFELSHDSGAARAGDPQPLVILRKVPLEGSDAPKLEVRAPNRGTSLEGGSVTDGASAQVEKRVHGFYWYIKKGDEAWCTRYFCVRAEGPRPSARVRATLDVAHWQRCGRFVPAKTRCPSCAYVGQGDNSYFRMPSLPDDSFPPSAKRLRALPSPALEAPAAAGAAPAPASPVREPVREPPHQGAAGTSAAAGAAPALASPVREPPPHQGAAGTSPPTTAALAPAGAAEHFWEELLRLHQEAMRRAEEARRQLVLSGVRADEEWRALEAAKRAAFETALAAEQLEHARGHARVALEQMTAAEAEASSIVERGRRFLSAL